jgi:hypothetical protein
MPEKAPVAIHIASATNQNTPGDCAPIFSNRMGPKTHPVSLLGIGFAGGLAALFSACVQGLIGAGACRALSGGNGKGLVFWLPA